MFSLDKYLSKAGIIAFNLVLTSLFMFCTIFIDKVYAAIVILALVAIACAKTTDVESFCYGHLCFLNMATMRWGIMPSCMFYFMFAFPYVFLSSNRYETIPIEQFVGLMVLQGLFFFMAKRNVLGQVTIWQACMLFTCRLHNGSYTWLVHVEQLKKTPSELMFRFFLEALLPMLVSGILLTIFSKSKKKVK